LKEQLRTLRRVHEAFSRGCTVALASYLGIPAQVKCVGVDQIGYGAFIQALPTPCPVVKLRVQPDDGTALLIIHPGVATGILDRMTGGAGFPDTAQRRFTGADRAVLTDVIALVLLELERAWQGTLKLAFTPEDIENSAEACRAAREEKVIAALTMEVIFAEARGMLSLCYPFGALAGCIERVAAQAQASGEQSHEAAVARNLQHAVEQLPVRVSARLGEARVTMERLAKLKPGSLLVLSRTTEQPVELLVNGRVRFTGHLGVLRGRKAVLIDARVS
jgi:flagellar motor switch protein FliM